MCVLFNRHHNKNPPNLNQITVQKLSNSVNCPDPPPMLCPPNYHVSQSYFVTISSFLRDTFHLSTIHNTLDVTEIQFSALQLRSVCVFLAVYFASARGHFFIKMANRGPILQTASKRKRPLPYKMRTQKGTNSLARNITSYVLELIFD
jgi:hypothetical protein